MKGPVMIINIYGGGLKVHKWSGMVETDSDESMAKVIDSLRAALIAMYDKGHIETCLTVSPNEPEDIDLDFEQLCDKINGKGANEWLSICSRCQERNGPGCPYFEKLSKSGEEERSEVE